MSAVSEREINKFEEQINERYEKLIETLRGKELPESMAGSYPYPMVSVNSSDLRVAIDDFMTILKETKKKIAR